MKEGVKYILKATQLGQPDAIYSYGIHLCSNKMYKNAEKFVAKISNSKTKNYLVKYCKVSKIGGPLKELIKIQLNNLAEMNNSKNNNKKYVNLLLLKACNDKQISQKLYEDYLNIIQSKKADEYCIMNLTNF